MPVCPTWSVCGRQPAIVTAREQPTAPPEQPGELLDRGEALGRPGAAAAAHDDLRVGQRDAAACVGLGALDHVRDEVGVGQVGREALDGGRRGRGGVLRLDGVRGDGEELRRAVQACLLEQAPAPADAGDRRGIARRRRDAVGGQRQVGDGGGVRHRLGRALAPRRDDGRRGEPRDQLRDRPPPRLRRVRGEAVVLGDVRLRDPERPEPGRGIGPAPISDRLERLPGRLGVAARERRGLAREVVGRAAVVLDEDEDGGHHRTPIRSSSSTTAGAASAPRPSTSVWEPSSTGTTRRTFSTPCGTPLRRPGVERLLLRPQAARAPTGSAAG